MDITVMYEEWYQVLRKTHIFQCFQEFFEPQVWVFVRRDSGRKFSSVFIVGRLQILKKAYMVKKCNQKVKIPLFG